MFFCFTQVHTAATKESLQEIFKELRDIRGPRPVSTEELEFSQNRLTMGFPQQFETINGIAGQMNDLVLYDLPLDEWRTYMTRVNACDSATIDAIARKCVRPDEAQIVIIGDWDEIEEGVRALNLGEITFVEADEL
jgi:zinc protease